MKDVDLMELFNIDPTNSYQQKLLENHNRFKSVLSELVSIRVAQGVSQQEVGEAMGITQPEVSRLESITSGVPSVTKLMAYASALGVELGLWVHKPLLSHEQARFLRTVDARGGLEDGKITVDIPAGSVEWNAGQLLLTKWGSVLLDEYYDVYGFREE